MDFGTQTTENSEGNCKFDFLIHNGNSKFCQKEGLSQG